MKALASIKVTTHVTGGTELGQAVAGLKAAVQNRVLRDAFRKQASKTAKLAKAGLGRGRTGHLKRSIGYIYRSYKNRTVWLYVIGPRVGKVRVPITALPKSSQARLVRRLGRFKRKRLTASDTRMVKTLAKTIDPAKYAHLVEGGRKAVRPKKARVMSDGLSVIGKRADAVGGTRFMAGAAAAISSQSAELVADVKAAVEREAAKAARSGKSIRG